MSVRGETKGGGVVCACPLVRRASVAKGPGRCQRVPGSDGGSWEKSREQEALSPERTEGRPSRPPWMGRVCDVGTVTGVVMVTSSDVPGPGVSVFKAQNVVDFLSPGHQVGFHSDQLSPGSKSVFRSHFKTHGCPWWLRQ